MLGLLPMLFWSFSVVSLMVFLLRNFCLLGFHSIFENGSLLLVGSRRWSFWCSSFWLRIIDRRILECPHRRPWEGACSSAGGQSTAAVKVRILSTFVFAQLDLIAHVYLCFFAILSALLVFSFALGTSGRAAP